MVDGLDEIRDHYESALELGADTGQKVGWRDTTAQALRFQAILQILGGLTYSSVCDMGCGTGDLLGFLRRRGWTGSYHGVDISPKMVSEGASRFRADRSAQFEVAASARHAEVIIASGIFNVSLGCSSENWVAYCREVVSQMWKFSSKAIVFNMLSVDSDVPHQKPGLAYMNPSEWLNFCRNQFSRHVRLDQAYGQFDFTIAIFRDPPEVFLAR